MEEQWDSRTQFLIGKDAIKKLKKAKVAVYGIGGVGSFAVEALVRAGIEELVMIDNDIISSSNINRQIHANINTIGKYKVEVMKQRILEINPNIKVLVYKEQESEEEKIIDSTFSYVIDAVDTISTKLKLVLRAKQKQVPIISAMGAGNKLDPTKFEISDIYKTTVCPLAKIMRKELRRQKIKDLKVVYSKEEPIKQKYTDEENKKISGSISFVPSVVGLIIASEVIKDIIS